MKMPIAYLSMPRRLAALALAAAFALAPATAAAQVATLKATSDSTTLIMGDVVGVNLQVVTNADDGTLVDMPEKKKDYYGLEMVGCHTDTIALPNGRKQIDYRFQFQAFYPVELLTLPPFRYAANGDTAQSDILTFKVLPVQLSPELGNIEVPDSLTIHPDAGPVAIPSRWYDYIPGWTLWALLALAAVALAVVLYILFKKKAVSLFPQRKPIPPYELAVERLNNLKVRRLLDQGQVKQYYTELIDILRNYLEGRFGINAMEMPSKQILRKIRENKEIRLSANQMEQVLQLADFVKFAAANPNPEDGKRTFHTIRDFVEATKPAPQPEENNNQTDKAK